MCSVFEGRPWLLVIALVVFVGGITALGIAKMHKDPSVKTEAEDCYDRSSAENINEGSQAKFEACICRLTQKYGCPAAKEAVPPIHHKFVEPCCEPVDDEPVQLHN